MALAGIGRLQAAKMDGSFENQGAAREKMEGAIAKHAEHVNKGYKAALDKIAEDKAAREKSSWGALLGTILLGPLIGTAIGEAIGGWANNGNEEASRQFGEAAENEGLNANRAFEEFEDAKENFEAAVDQTSSVEDLQKELSDIGWNGLS